MPHDSLSTLVDFKTPGACGEAACSPTTSCRTRRLQCLCSASSYEQWLFLRTMIYLQNSIRTFRKIKVYMSKLRAESEIWRCSRPICRIQKIQRGWAFWKVPGSKILLWIFFLAKTNKNFKKNKNNKVLLGGDGREALSESLCWKTLGSYPLKPPLEALGERVWGRRLYSKALKAPSYVSVGESVYVFPGSHSNWLYSKI